MTFEKEIENILNSEDYGAFGMSVDTVVNILEKLKREYAPTVEMTKEQVDELKKCTKTVSDEFDEDEIPSDSDIKMTDKLFDPGDNFILLRNMSAILHSETIKVIGEKHDN